MKPSRRQIALAIVAMGLIGLGLLGNWARHSILGFILLVSILGSFMVAVVAHRLISGHWLWDELAR
jgi:hypothetical protein